MDIGLIILIIIASLIGNIFKKPKKHGETGRSYKNTNSKPEWPPFSPYRPPGADLPTVETIRQRTVQQKPIVLNIPREDREVPKAVKELEEYDAGTIITLEDKRMDIGSTYEEVEIPSISIESEKLGNTNTDYTKSKEIEVHAYDREGDSADISSHLELSFNEESLIKGIIMAEVISPPKCRR